MPSTRVYFVDFADGNVIPSLDVLEWGQMKTGETSGPGHSIASDPEGLIVGANRLSGWSAQVSTSVYVMPRELPVESRFAIRLGFDTPFAAGHFDDKNPWAVGLLVKKDASVHDTPGEPVIATTCQFRTENGNTGVGIRLNTPANQQGDNKLTATNLASSADYSPYSGDNGLVPRVPFTLEFLFCGAGAVSPLGFAVGYGSLRIGEQSDQRVFSHKGLWPPPLLPTVAVGEGPTIGALGASVVIAGSDGPPRGADEIRARLRTFAVDLWPLRESVSTGS